MLSKEEIEKNRISKQLAKALGIEKEDSDSLIAFKESIFEETVRENIKLKKQIEQLESDKQDLIEKLEKDTVKANEIINDQEYRYIDEVIDEQYERRKYAQEIIDFMKGKKE